MVTTQAGLLSSHICSVILLPWGNHLLRVTVPHTSSDTSRCSGRLQPASTKLPHGFLPRGRECACSVFYMTAPNVPSPGSSLPLGLSLQNSLLKAGDAGSSGSCTSGAHTVMPTSLQPSCTPPSTDAVLGAHPHKMTKLA